MRGWDPRQIFNELRQFVKFVKKSVNASKFQRNFGKNYHILLIFVIFCHFCNIFVQICQFEDVMITQFLQQFVDLQNLSAGDLYLSHVCLFLNAHLVHVWSHSGHVWSQTDHCYNCGNDFITGKWFSMHKGYI